MTWAAKYRFNRKPPGQMAPDITAVALLTDETPAQEPSYSSEHEALAGTAVGILTAFFPEEEANLKATAADLGQTRPLMGTWKSWLMRRGDQFRPAPPPAVDSAEFQDELG